MFVRRLLALTVSLAAISPSIAVANDFYIQSGQPVAMMTRTELNTKDNRAGDRFYMEVAENVIAKGQIVIPAGTLAVGEVIQSERNGHFGKRGSMTVRALYIDTATQHIPLSGTRDMRGRSGTLAMVATSLVVSPLGLLIHGTSGHIHAGTPIMAYLADDLRFTMRTDGAEQETRNYAPVTSGQRASLPSGTSLARNNR